MESSLFCFARVRRWGRAPGGLVGGRQRKWLEPPWAVWTVPLQAGKSQTQRSDIWEALGSVCIFRRPDMPRILGVAEPEKQGGQQKVNQKKWPEPATFLTKVS